MVYIGGENALKAWWLAVASYQEYNNPMWWVTLMLTVQ